METFIMIFSAIVPVVIGTTLILAASLHASGERMRARAQRALDEQDAMLAILNRHRNGKDARAA